MISVEMLKEDLAYASMFLGDNTIGWSTASTKQFILTNPMDCADLRIRPLAAQWSGSGHYEWEVQWATQFILAVVSAVASGQSEADLSEIFARDYTAYNGKKYFSHEQLWDLAKDSFAIESDNGNTIRFKAVI